MTTITIERELLEQALAVLLRFPIETRTVWKDGIDLDLPTSDGEKHEQAIADLRAALSAPATAPEHPTQCGCCQPFCRSCYPKQNSQPNPPKNKDDLP